MTTAHSENFIRLAHGNSSSAKFRHEAIVVGAAQCGMRFLRGTKIIFDAEMDLHAATFEPTSAANDEFNVVCTTYRLTEHYHYWTKNNPMNVQLVPEPFVEIPVELAEEMGLKGGERVKVSSARGSYVAKAMVTRRIKPMQIDGKKTYQIGIPIHWGYRGIAEDAGRTALASTNLLSPTVFDPNAYTPEFKGFLVKIEKA